jgi:hypothetical protein
VTARLIAGAALVALLAGPGAAAATPEPTPAEYVAHVSAVCQRYGRQLDLIPPPGDLAIPGEVVGRVERALPLLKAELARIRAIPSPSALRPRLARFFALTQRSIDELGHALAAARRRDLGAMADALDRFATARDAAKKLSHALGFRC